jgi:putative CocE/NonD family hydrolase
VNSAAPQSFDLRSGIAISLRDGVQLSATEYIPTDREKPGPCLFIITPYIADTHHARGVYFATHGFALVIVDARGRGNSGGVFRPMIQEAEDGYDVAEWLAVQPYCDGQVAMCGGSYLGYSQWATAKKYPPHLATIIPAAAPYMGIDFPMRKNIFYPYLVRWLVLVAGRASQNVVVSDAALWARLFAQWHTSGRSFRDLDKLIWNPSGIFQEWLDHPHPDSYWDAYNPTVDEYAQLTLPILTITGSYDDDQPGALEHYRQHVRHASATARNRHYLIVGPWDHAGTGWQPQMEVGGIKLGKASLIDIPKLHLEWYAWTMLGGEKPAFLKKQVAYYVMGAEEWRYAESLEAATAHTETYYLDSTGHANDVFSAGHLSRHQGRGAPDVYTFDPGAASGLEVDAETNASGGSLVDQSLTIALRGKQLVYHSSPFEHNTEISGVFELHAWISVDCPDTDLFASVYEIGLDGGSIRLSTDGVRARYRESLRAPKLIATQEPLRYDFECFTFVSRRIRKGHRLRLVIAPMGHLIEATFAEKNYNGGGIVAEECVKDARAVTVRLFHDEAHPSALYVPIGHEKSSDECKAENCVSPDIRT